MEMETDTEELSEVDTDSFLDTVDGLDDCHCCHHTWMETCMVVTHVNYQVLVWTWLYSL